MLQEVKTLEMPAKAIEENKQKAKHRGIDTAHEFLIVEIEHSSFPPGPYTDLHMYWVLPLRMDANQSINNAKLINRYLSLIQTPEDEPGILVEHKYYRCYCITITNFLGLLVKLCSFYSSRTDLDINYSVFSIC